MSKTSYHHTDDLGDHLHLVSVVENGHAGPTCDFDYAALENWDEPSANENDECTIGEASSALGVIIDWVCSGTHPNVVASRALGLQFWLRPHESVHDSLAQIARDCGLTTASLSKSLLNLKDQVGIKLPVGKRHFTRRTFADKQRELLAAGKHSSQTRRKHKKTAK